MVEVFKTGVCQVHVAEKLVLAIEAAFPGYKANFDLNDCDHILRIEHETEIIDAGSVVMFLHNAGYDADLLIDEINAVPHRETCRHHDQNPPVTADYFPNICIHLQRIYEN